MGNPSPIIKLIFKASLFLSVVLPAVVFAQLKPSEMGFTQLKGTADNMIKSGHLVKAIPYLEEVENRTIDNKGKERQPLETIWFFLGQAHMVASGGSSAMSLNTALEYLNKVEKEFPKSKRMHMVILSQAECYLGMKEDKKALPLFEKALNEPYVHMLDDKLRDDTLDKLVTLYYSAQDWNKGKPWFKKLMETSPKSDRRARGAASLIESYVSSKNEQGALSLIPFILKAKSARNSPQLNMALLKAGHMLSGRGMYQQAMLLYTMTLTPPQMAEYYKNQAIDSENRIKFYKVKRRDDLVDKYKIMKSNDEHMAKALRGMKDYGKELELLIAQVYLDADRGWEAYYAFRGIIEKYPTHPNIEDFVFSTFQSAHTMGLPEKAREIADGYLANPSFKKYRKDVGLVTMQNFLEDENYEGFFGLAEEYIEQFSDKEETATVIYMMGNAMLGIGQTSQLIQKFEKYIEKYSKAPWLDGCYYWSGLSGMYNQDYPMALKFFNPMYEKYPKSTYAEDAEYRRAICIYGSGKPDEAMVAFTGFNEKYSQSKLSGEIQFFLGEIYSSKKNIEDAIKHYSLVEEKGAAHSYIKNAYFSIGKLLKEAKRYDEMIANYEKYTQNFQEEGDLAAAIFEIGMAKELQGKPGELQEVYINAIREYGDNQDSEGVDLMIESFVSKYYSGLERMNATIDFFEKFKSDSAFRDQILDDKSFLYDFFQRNKTIEQSYYKKFRKDKAYGKGLRNDMSVIDAQLAHYRTQKSKFPKKTPVELFTPLYQEAKSDGRKTLEFRLQMALEGRGENVNPGMVFTQSDFDYATPKLLIWMAKKTMRSAPEMAKGAVNKVLEEYPDSPAVLDAFITMAELAELNKDYDQAIEYYARLAEDFWSEPNSHEFISKQGDLMRKNGNNEGARGKYMEIMQAPEYKGAPQTEALYKIGMSYYDEEKYPEAHGFFERVFIGYGFFIEIATKAYLMDAETLLKMNQREDARNTLKECIDNGSFKEAEAYSALRDKYDEIK